MLEIKFCELGEYILLSKVDKFNAIRRGIEVTFRSLGCSHLPVIFTQLKGHSSRFVVSFACICLPPPLTLILVTMTALIIKA